MTRMEHSDLEIMAPAGNFECLEAALQAGADSVYFGVGQLNMRSRSANNFTESDLDEVVRRCHRSGAKAYLTLNITLYQGDLAPMRSLLRRAKEAGIDAVIASDMACIAFCREIGLSVHISTQLSLSNLESLRFYAAYADVAVLARELDLAQVRQISDDIREEGITGPAGQPVRLEMFVHGAVCMAVSGRCYLSLHAYGASANRGACYQVCRRSYLLTDAETGEKLQLEHPYLLSPKDLCTIAYLDRIVDAGVRVFKIEGRARSAEYVRRTVSCYRQAADAVADGTFTEALGKQLEEKLAEVFNRGFWEGFYQGAPMGQWSTRYGSQATRCKTYVGKVTNWFDRIGVAEIQLESGRLAVGDDILVIGATTGVYEGKVTQIRLETDPVPEAVKGDLCSVPVAFGANWTGERKLRRGDRVYLWEEADRG